MRYSLYSYVVNPAYMLLAIIALFVLLYFSTLEKILTLWTDSETYSHGLLLFVISMYLFMKIWWKRRDATIILFNLTGFLLLLLSSLAWLAFKVVLINGGELLCAVLILVTAFIGLLGWQQSKHYLFPVLLITLALPLFGWVVQPLQRITSVLNGVLLDLFNITNIVEGVLILVPAGTFEVDRGCSGINVLMVGMILALLHSYINNYKIMNGIFLVFLAIIFSVVSNIIRVFIIVVAGNETQMQHPLVYDHVWLGWVVFIIIMGLFYYLIGKYGTFLNMDKSGKQAENEGILLYELSDRSAFYPIKSILIIVVGLCIAPMLASAYMHENEKAYVSNYKIPDQLAQWKVVDKNNPIWNIGFKGGEGDIRVDRVYDNQHLGTVNLNSRFFIRQSENNEAVNQANIVYDRNSWTRVWVKSLNSDVDSMAPFNIEETLVRDKKNEEVLIWRWYTVLGQSTANEYKVKLYTLAAVFMGKPETAVYVLSTKVTQSYDDARKILNNFVSALNPAIL